METNPYVLLPEHLKLVGAVDEFKGRWNAVANLSPEQLSELRSVATIQSIGSSTRIEGVKLSDLEIQHLLSGLNVKKLSGRDEQEVAGYADAVNYAFNQYDQMSISELEIKRLHQRLLQFSVKDQKHAGQYKNVPNHIEAFDASGKSLGIVYETVAPEDTPRYMTELVDQLMIEMNEASVHPLLTIAMFHVQFLAIHPFDDGNGRLARILTNLLLLKAGYTYVPYCSLEKIIEDNKDRYYMALNQTQATLFTDNSNFQLWISFFLSVMHQQMLTLKEKIDSENVMSDLPPLSRDILAVARSRGKLTVSDSVKATGANRNTIKVHIQHLVKRGLLQQYGQGKGTWYEPA